MGVTALGAAGLFVSTLPPGVSLCVQPFSMLLIPGYLLESLDHNTYAFATHNILAFSCAIYFCTALLVLFRRSSSAAQPLRAGRRAGRGQPGSARQAARANR